jgi:hypothetical protein
MDRGHSVKETKLTKGDIKVVYMGPEKGPFQCQRCEYYSRKTPERGECEKVTGVIQAQACCNLFHKATSAERASGLIVKEGRDR